MNEPEWAGVVPQETVDLYERAGFGHHTPIGRKPALLVIDVQYATTGEHPMPLPQALDYHPMNCGSSAWEAVAKIAELVGAFRALNSPVIYPHVAPRKVRDPNRRMPMASEFNPRHWEIVEEVAPVGGDIVIPKTGPSAFTGTPLVNHLIKLGVDTLVLAGNTTSGCIRASATDAYAFHFKVMVVSDAVYDRSPISHAVSLFDIHNKYAEVVDTATAIQRVRTAPA
jgi:maleamate amidohydrolase